MRVRDIRRRQRANEIWSARPLPPVRRAPPPARSPRERFVVIGLSMGMSPEQCWAGFDFLRQAGLSETAALTFGTQKALEGWPPAEAVQ